MYLNIEQKFYGVTICVASLKEYYLNAFYVIVFIFSREGYKGTYY